MKEEYLLRPLRREAYMGNEDPFSNLNNSFKMRSILLSYQRKFGNITSYLFNTEAQ